MLKYFFVFCKYQFTRIKFYRNHENYFNNTLYKFKIHDAPREKYALLQRKEYRYFYIVSEYQGSRKLLR